jgi:hypothetical protein
MDKPIGYVIYCYAINAADVDLERAIDEDHNLHGAKLSSTRDY